MADQRDQLSAATAGRYHIERELGRGGMATVYLADDLRHQRKVAIKVLRPELAVALGSDRFVREIETTAGLHHPHVLALYDSGQAGDLLYYVMPYVSGESLRDRLGRERQLPIDAAVRIAHEVADALGYAHDRGLVHRDIKPENILLEGGHAMVADFGIAKAVAAAGGETLTQTGMAIGTPHYMSPEQATAAAVDARSDLYSLGCVLYEMLAGEPPYTGPTAQAITAKRLMRPVPSVSVVRETVSPALEAVVTRALAKAPADRFPNAAAFVEALRRVEPGTPGAGPTLPAARGTRRRPAVIWAMAAAAAVAAIGLGYLGLRGGDPPPPVSEAVVAVVPFSVGGSPDVAYLGEGMVDLLTAKLDGTGLLRAVNPRVVMALVSGEPVDAADPTALSRLAARMGAGRYVTGDVVEAGGRIQVTAYLHRTVTPSDIPVRATAAGSVEQLFEVVDSLALALVAGAMPESGARLQRLATTTTASLPALRHFLQGERFIRAGQYGEAFTAYESAVGIDTTFALAHYRKSLVAEWIDAYDPRSSADKAFAFAERLSPRDRSLLAALRLRRRGASTEAEQAFQTHLHRWPDEVEALVQLGEIQFHDNPRRGRPLADGIPLFEQAVRLEPGNANARIHLARLYGLYGQIDSLRSTARAFEATAEEDATFGSGQGGEERLLEVLATEAYTVGDTAAQRRILARMDGKPWPYWFLVAHAVSRFARDPAGAQALLARRATDEPIVVMLVGTLPAARGQLQAYRKFLDDIPGGRTPLWDLHEAFAWTSGALEPDTARMAWVLERLRTADPAEILRRNWVPAYEDLTVEFHRFERDYNVALLLIHLGRIDEARRMIASLESRPPLQWLGNLREDALRSLRAELLHRAGDLDQALAVLRTITYEAPHSATYHAFVDGARTRFLRAELELDRGDRNVARVLYQGLDESWSPFDIYHRPIVYQRLGEIADAEGRTADAVEWYSRLVDLWRDADASLRPLRDAIQQRREHLRGPR